MTMLQFSAFSSMVEPTFWHKLNQIKLDEDRLEEKERTIWGNYSNLESDGAFFLDAASFNKSGDAAQKNLVRGVLFNFNTIEAFKESDKSELIHKYGRRLEQSWTEEGTQNEAPQFLLISFADLKKYHFYYWFAFLAPKNPSAEIIGSPLSATEVFNEKQITQLEGLLDDCGQSFCLKVLDDAVEIHPLSAFGTLKSSGSRVVLGFADPSQAEAPGWPLRCILKEISLKWPSPDQEVEVLSLRLSKQGPKLAKSLVLKVKLGAAEGEEGQWVGWERNERGKLGPRLANLSSSMDPKKLAECAVDLNLKLMKWRLLPQIDLDVVKNCRCLLLGAGTLGCAVARVLLGWGVRRVTFLDCGRVSYSNPVRQSLFLHQHCLGAGALKAKAAAESLVAIFPGVESEGVELSIPMPGHPLIESQHEQVKQDIEKLEKLVSEHDAVFLLTDSRESRWLPTLLCKSQNKLVINAALGFDSYLVMRHGVSCKDEGESEEAAATSSTSSTSSPTKRKSIPGNQLGCYFCNDVVAPRNSMSQRSLDQQCTVVRPGVSQIAAALAVELLVSLLQHPKQGGAPANCDPDQPTPESSSPLGILPHSIRGYLAQMQTILPATESFPQCAACSPLILQEYQSKGFEFLLKVFNCPGFLEDLTGLAELQKRSDEAEIWALSDSDGDIE